MTSAEKLQKSLPDGVDAALILSRHNRRYFTGFDSTEGIVFITREKAVFLVDFRYYEAAKAKVKSCGVELYESRKKDLPKLAARSGARRIAVESYEIPVSFAAKLKEELEGVRIDCSDSLSELIEALRMVKRPDEIAVIAKAQEIADLAFSHALDFIRPGVSEREAALELEYFMRKNGAEDKAFDLIVVSGENTSLPHGTPGNRVFQSGDFITIDMGAVCQGYCSDMTRTVALGQVSEEQKAVYGAVLASQLEAERAIKAGALCSDIDKIARDLITAAGYGGCFGHGLGHGVGLQVHEAPRFSPSCGTKLRKNMVMTVEPGIYLENRFGVRIEDLVLVTADGCRIFTRSPKELIVL
jgi:Xaa-Pro aminopeptidase